MSAMQVNSEGKPHDIQSRIDWCNLCTAIRLTKRLLDAKPWLKGRKNSESCKTCELKPPMFPKALWKAF
jgi:hypothetical protein